MDTEKLKTSISQEVWRNLHLGSKIKDSIERIWTVVAGDFIGGNPDILFAFCPGHGEEELKWLNEQILTDDGTVVIELTNPLVEIVI